MNCTRALKALVVVAGLLLMTACATRQPYDYSAFKESNPRSILVLPPLNNTPEVQASYSVLSYTTMPLAESGYYVMPVTLVAETFRENGLTQAADMHATPAAKLREIFGADAALYITITEYGTVYRVLSSASIVTAAARLVDLKTGKLLWAGAATASSEEGKSQQGGVASLLITAIVKQVIGTATDKSHEVAGITTARLLYANQINGILPGPRSPNHGKN